MPKISEEQRNATQSRLVEAAVRVILERGAEATTTRRILEEAGLSAGALYHYFATKDDLYEAVAERFADLDNTMTGPVDGLTVEQAIEHHVTVLTTLFSKGTTSILGQLRASARSNSGLARGLTHFDDVVLARSSPFNRATQQLGLFRDDVDPDALVEVISTFFESFVIREAQGGFSTDRTRVLGLFLDMLADRVIDPAHPAAPELRHQMLQVAEG